MPYEGGVLLLGENWSGQPLQRHRAAVDEFHDGTSAFVTLGVTDCEDPDAPEALFTGGAVGGELRSVPDAPSRAARPAAGTRVSSLVVRRDRSHKVCSIAADVPAPPCCYVQRVPGPWATGDRGDVHTAHTL